MRLTEEQNLIADSNNNATINARAGSGKTSTLYYYVKSRPDYSRILYIAFNKSVQEEGEKKFADIDHVFIHVRTAHSLAYEAIVKKYRYNVGRNFFTPEFIAKTLNIDDDFVLCTHVVKLVDFYCTCAEKIVDDVNYLATLKSPEALEYVNDNYEEILNCARKIIGMMDNKEIPITDDFYLKKWQLSEPRLNYDYILFDEGQDASATMLDIFKRQKGTKIIVGDTHQQIYSWRNAVNSLDQVPYNKYELSTSFRFSDKIAKMAIKTIKWKKDILGDNSVENFNLIGAGISHEVKTKAVIGRSNSSLMIDAISKVIKNKTVKKPYFEGGFNNYSLGNMKLVTNDIINIINGKTENVVSENLKGLNNLKELEKFIEEIEDFALKQVLELVNEYGEDLNTYIEELKNSISESREEADVIFSTVHKSKGMEYDDVELLDDFSSKMKLKKMLENCDSEFIDVMKKNINEEINLIYVAVTRSKNLITIPNNILKDIE